MGFAVNTPIQQPNAPPTIDSTPSPAFTQGNQAVYDFSQDITDDGVSALTYSVTGTLASGLSLNATTGLLTYDGAGGASANNHQLQVDDGVNPVVTSNQFPINVVIPSSDIIFGPYNHSAEPLGRAGLISGVFGPSTNGAYNPPDTFWDIDGASPMTTTETKYFHTKLTKLGNTVYRTERSEKTGQTLRDTPMISVGGGHYKAAQKYWYGMLIRFDGYSNITRRGHIVQWHNVISGFNSPRLSLQFDSGDDNSGPGGASRSPVATSNGGNGVGGIGVYMENNDDFTDAFGGSDDVFSATLIDKADIIGPVRAFIWEIFWDTRDAAGGSEGIVRLFIDDNSTAVFEHGTEGAGKNNYSAGGSDGKVPFFKWGLYKSLWKSSGSADGQFHEQSYNNFCEMGAGGSRIAMLQALNWANRI